MGCFWLFGLYKMKTLRLHLTTLNTRINAVGQTQATLTILLYNDAVLPNALFHI